MKKPFKIYFDDKGNMLYRYYKNFNQTIKEEDNHIFSDSMVYVSQQSSHVVFKSELSSRTFLMFESDFHKTIKAKKFQDNKLEGQFTYTKKGRVQGFRMILPKEPEAPEEELDPLDI